MAYFACGAGSSNDVVRSIMSEESFLCFGSLYMLGLTVKAIRCKHTRWDGTIGTVKIWNERNIWMRRVAFLRLNIVFNFLDLFMLILDFCQD